MSSDRKKIAPRGFERASRLNAELEGYVAAGLQPVIIGQGEPERAAAYRAEHNVPCTILCDAAPELWSHARDVGVDFQRARRDQGQPLVDDPWRAVKEFVVGTNGLIRLNYSYQYCEDYPNPQVLTTAARLS